MNKQKTTDSKVLVILRERPGTRYDDTQLVLCYCNRYSYMRAGDSPLGDIVNNRKGYGLPCFETIRRAGQRVQSLFLELSRQCSGCDCGNIRTVIKASRGVGMNEGKRKIGEYTVLCSANAGEKEVILTSNEQSINGDKFMCGFAERNNLFELCSECMVSDDYIEIVHLFGSRVVNEAELFKGQAEKLDIPTILITEADCTFDYYSEDISGKIIAIGLKVLKPEFQRTDRQLYYVTGDFGASANSRESAVFRTNLHTDRSIRYERMDVMGEVKPERLPGWAKEEAQELLHKKRNKDKE